MDQLSKGESTNIGFGFYTSTAPQPPRSTDSNGVRSALGRQGVDLRLWRSSVDLRLRRPYSQLGSFGSRVKPEPRAESKAKSKQQCSAAL